MIGVPHTSHWGAFHGEAGPDGLRVTPWPGDPDPSPLLDNLAGTTLMQARVERPRFRRGWLRDGPGPDARRGDDTFTTVPWDEALDLLAAELRRVYDEHGPTAVYGSSYGWASAGRFHHAQSQVHRFLNCLGGYTRSENTYSLGASRIVLGHVLGSTAAIDTPTTWDVIAEHTDLFVAFGGIAPKNAAVVAGGTSRHEVQPGLRAAAEAGTRFVNVSPLRDDAGSALDAEWLPIRPGTDTALMLALCRVLDAEGLLDEAFLATHTVGHVPFRASLRGAADGLDKTPRWAAEITGLPAERITALAHEMAASRTMINVSWSLQRARHGEQPLWAGIALAALLGQIGLPGGGFGHGYSATGSIGVPLNPVGSPTFPQGRNTIDSSIPVARIADMLLHPGAPYDYDGQRRHYPDIRLVYWAGGNPFHHHQDLARLAAAFRTPETVVVHEPFWTSTAAFADVVLPTTTTAEREDIGGSKVDPRLVAMHRLIEPVGGSRDDYAVFADLAARLGRGAEFTEGRDARGWLEAMWERWRPAGAPPFAEFWAAGEYELPTRRTAHVLYDAFRADPAAAPLPTPSGRIELFSETVAGFGYDDCPGHPTWLGPAFPDDPTPGFPLALVANNPADKLHSQLDHGAHSARSKVHGRQPLRMHPDDARERGLVDGDVVVLRSTRGSALAGLVLSEDVRTGVVQMSTGAWFDPVAGAAGGVTCGHGNVNAVTVDVGTSRLTQACSGQLTRVQVTRFDGPLPAVRAHDGPPAGTGLGGQSGPIGEDKA